jgi:hypothetical protein
MRGIFRAPRGKTSAGKTDPHTIFSFHHKGHEGHREGHEVPNPFLTAKTQRTQREGAIYPQISLIATDFQPYHLTTKIH